MYMYVKLFSGDLNSDLCLLHPTSIYTCGVTTAPRVCGGGICFNGRIDSFIYKHNYYKCLLITTIIIKFYNLERLKNKKEKIIFC